jgi:hypothetical protein
MEDNTADANNFARNSQTRTTATAVSDMNVFEPIALFQVSMLMMWPTELNVAGNYERALDETRQATLRQARVRIKLH